MNVNITKASGEVERFSEEKLRESLRRSGADPKTVDDVVKLLLPEIKPNMTTARIYRLARKYLRRLHHPTGLRYSLKNAIFKLGPTGYPFERFFGKVVESHGYKVDVGVILKGRCITHEVDVFARKDDEVCVVECKYHNTPGKATNSKDALYVHSRFRDLEPTIRERFPGARFSGWLVTNTRLSSDAIKYARCAGYTAIGWKHPHDGGLEKMIESQRQYPVTVISGIERGLIEKLIKNDIVLLLDLARMSVTDIMKTLSLPERKAERLKKQAESVCLC
ncbi:MAG: ATPase [Nitrospirae bacterium]|nr:MAG: ATPase [Nitrospirota bacterium]